jgi:hypothetical protein
VVKLKDGGLAFALEDLAEAEERPWLGEGGDVMKVLHVDRDAGQVVFIQRMSRDSSHPFHRHHCTAIAYTLRGCWEYQEQQFPSGILVLEPHGSEHAATTRGDNSADVLVILTARPGSSRLLEIQTPEGGVELDLAAFERLYRMRSNDEWRAFAVELEEGRRAS